MKCVVLTIFLSSSLISLNAMQREQLNSEECSVTFQIQVPSPIRDIPENQIDLTNEQAIIEYLQTLQDPNEIPISMYDTLIKETNSSSISVALSNILLTLWGINPDILVSGKNDIIKSIGDTLLDVKTVQTKK